MSSFFARDTQIVARELLGSTLKRRTDDGQIVCGVVVETEAYHGQDDQACHARMGLTQRNAPMFGPPGHAYVYQIYGMWFCLNAVTMESGFPSAVLIRGVHPANETAKGWADGPGKLCRAFAIDKSLSGAKFGRRSGLWFEEGSPRGKIHTGPRVGVDYAGSWAQKPWRFWTW